MTYFLGFDGGGTKTECVLVDQGGKEAAKSIGRPSNPLRAGYPKTWFALGSTADAVLERHHLKASDIRGICAGLGGAGQQRVAHRVVAYFKRAFPNAAVRVTTDLDIALEAAVASKCGVLLVAGTGSAACGRDAQGRTVRAGGRGPWIGDEGSGFEVGRRAVAAVGRAQDGLAPATALTDLILEASGADNWDNLTERIIASPDDVFPGLFPVVLKTAVAGDAVAEAIISDSATALADLVRIVVQKLGCGGETFPIVKFGGMFGRHKLFDDAVDDRLKKIAQHARVELLRTSPALAAARMAQRAAGMAMSA
jgi:N-acetylglucosamine kinase-like BadF-type ATPase